MERWQAAGQAWRAGAMLAALGGAVGLAGCMSATPTPLPQAAAPPLEVAPPPPAPEAVLPPHPLHKPEPPTIAALPAAPSETAPAAPPSAGETEPDFARLTGLDQDQTLATLGQPQQRAEVPARRAVALYEQRVRTRPLFLSRSAKPCDACAPL